MRSHTLPRCVCSNFAYFISPDFHLPSTWISYRKYNKIAPHVAQAKWISYKIVHFKLGETMKEITDLKQLKF